MLQICHILAILPMMPLLMFFVLQALVQLFERAMCLLYRPFVFEEDLFPLCCVKHYPVK